jgi:transposase
VGYFAGLDVSLEETAICVVDTAGLIVREARVASEPEALVAFFRASGMVMERIGLEACSLTAWLHQGLTEAGCPQLGSAGRGWHRRQPGDIAAARHRSAPR